MRIIMVFAGRFPGEKAAALFLHDEARSFAARGNDVIVLAPRRFGRREAQQLPYRVSYVPTVDLLSVPLLGPVAGYINLLFLSWTAALWFVWRGRREDVVFSNEVLPLLFLTVLTRNTVYELHDFPASTRIYKTLFRRVKYIVATNTWKKEALIRLFSTPEEKIILERTGVDTDLFGKIEKVDARAKLGLSQSANIALYTGQLYSWKGADTFAEAARFIPDTECVFVGGIGKDLADFKERWRRVSNIKIIGQIPHREIPRWQAAADVLVLPNTAREEISKHYTSPMKLFEYMASERPIVLSDLPSLREIVSGEEAYFAQPDSPQSFARAIQTVFENPAAAGERARHARERAGAHSWDARAERLLSHIL